MGIGVEVRMSVYCTKIQKRRKRARKKEERRSERVVIRGHESINKMTRLCALVYAWCSHEHSFFEMDSCFPPLAALRLRDASESSTIALARNRLSGQHDSLRSANLPPDKIEILQDLDLYYIRQIAHNLKVLVCFLPQTILSSFFQKIKKVTIGGFEHLPFKLEKKTFFSR